MMALDEVHPAFGVSEDELQQVIANGIIHFDGNIEVTYSVFPFERSSVLPDCTLIHSSPAVYITRRIAVRRTSAKVRQDAVRQRSGAW